LRVLGVDESGTSRKDTRVRSGFASQSGGADLGRKIKRKESKKLKIKKEISAESWTRLGSMNYALLGQRRDLIAEHRQSPIIAPPEEVSWRKWKR